MLIIFKCHTLSATDGGIGHPRLKEIKNTGRKCGVESAVFLVSLDLSRSIVWCRTAKGKFMENIGEVLKV